MHDNAKHWKLYKGFIVQLKPKSQNKYIQYISTVIQYEYEEETID